MSLKQEERDIMVALEMEKADSTFAEHEGLTEKGYWSNLAIDCTTPCFMP